MNNKFIIVSLLLVTLLLVGGVILLGKGPKPNPQLDLFTKCLAEKKLVMYGAYWCPHCQAQKKLFGDSVQYLPYVECTQQTKLCLDQKIEGYPTWIDAAGSRYSGEQSLQKLAEISQCQL